MKKPTGKHRYHPVQERVWNDPSFCSLSKAQPNAQTLWLYFLTCENRKMPGIILAHKAAIAADLRWEVAELEPLLLELEQKKMACFDWSARLTYLPKALAQECNKPQSPNVAAMWHRTMNDLGISELTKQIDLDVRTHLKKFSKKHLKYYLSGIGTRKKNQQDQKQSKPDKVYDKAYAKAYDKGRVPVSVSVPVDPVLVPIEGEGRGRSGVTANEFDNLWSKMTKKTAMLDAHLKNELITRINQTALVREEDPGQFVPKIILAYVEMIDSWRKNNKHSGAPALAEFILEKKFNAAINWLDGKRAVAKEPNASGKGQWISDGI